MYLATCCNTYVGGGYRFRQCLVARAYVLCPWLSSRQISVLFPVDMQCYPNYCFCECAKRQASHIHTIPRYSDKRRDTGFECENMNETHIIPWQAPKSLKERVSSWMMGEDLRTSALSVGRPDVKGNWRIRRSSTTGESQHCQMAVNQVYFHIYLLMC